MCEGTQDSTCHDQGIPLKFIFKNAALLQHSCPVARKVLRRGNSHRPFRVKTPLCIACMVHVRGLHKLDRFMKHVDCSWTQLRPEMGAWLFNKKQCIDLACMHAWIMREEPTPASQHRDLTSTYSVTPLLARFYSSTFSPKSAFSKLHAPTSPQQL